MRRTLHHPTPTAILPGRHQPPHNDHLRIIEATLRALPDHVDLVIGMVTSPPVLLPAGGPLDLEAWEHHQPDRTPVAFIDRTRLLEAALDDLLPARQRRRVLITALPRPEADWRFIEVLFPKPRLWVVPDCGEVFDDLKASFFAHQGDRVLRVPITPTTDGRTVRRLLAAGDPALRHHVPPAVYAGLTGNAHPARPAAGGTCPPEARTCESAQ